MPIPVMICWSENERSSLRHIGAEVDFRSPSRMIIALRPRDMKFVMMKLSSVPAPATPASVGVVSGTTEQFPEKSTVMAPSVDQVTDFQCCRKECVENGMSDVEIDVALQMPSMPSMPSVVPGVHKQVLANA